MSKSIVHPVLFKDKINQNKKVSVKIDGSDLHISSLDDQGLLIRHTHIVIGKEDAINIAERIMRAFS